LSYPQIALRHRQLMEPTTALAFLPWAAHHALAVVWSQTMSSRPNTTLMEKVQRCTEIKIGGSMYPLLIRRLPEILWCEFNSPKDLSTCVWVIASGTIVRCRSSCRRQPDPVYRLLSFRQCFWRHGHERPAPAMRTHYCRSKRQRCAQVPLSV
jgi:hypothetical protein